MVDQRLDVTVTQPGDTKELTGVSTSIDRISAFPIDSRQCNDEKQHSPGAYFSTLIFMAC
jgi:hypothetical protein